MSNISTLISHLIKSKIIARLSIREILKIKIDLITCLNSPINEINFSEFSTEIYTTEMCNRFFPPEIHGLTHRLRLIRNEVIHRII